MTATTTVRKARGWGGMERALTGEDYTAGTVEMLRMFYVLTWVVMYFYVCL